MGNPQYSHEPLRSIVFCIRLIVFFCRANEQGFRNIRLIFDVISSCPTIALKDKHFITTKPTIYMEEGVVTTIFFKYLAYTRFFFCLFCETLNLSLQKILKHRKNPYWNNFGNKNIKLKILLIFFRQRARSVFTLSIALLVGQ